jgi:hypothetical protein
MTIRRFKISSKAKRVYDSLIKEHKFEGILRTIIDYVSKNKKKLYTKQHGYLPLQHDMGKAQVDFKDCLLINPQIKIVSRDRATTYTKAISEAYFRYPISGML